MKECNVSQGTHTWGPADASGVQRCTNTSATGAWKSCPATKS